MKITYDPGVDALSIQFVERGRSGHTKEMGEGIHFDYNTRGKLVAIEILDASRFASAEALGKLDSAREMLTLSEASEESALEHDTLRKLIHNGRLPAEKQGRDWMVSRANLLTYLDSRDRRGGGRKGQFAKAG
jgi:excisionase family DNA binding protein